MILDCRAVCVLLPRVGRSLNMHSCLVVETPVKTKVYITHTELLHPVHFEPPTRHLVHITPVSVDNRQGGPSKPPLNLALPRSSSLSRRLTPHLKTVSVVMHACIEW